MQFQKTRHLFFIAAILICFAPTAFSYSASQSIYFDWTFDSGIQYGWSGDGHSYDYASYIDFYEGSFADGALGGTWIGTASSLDADMHWSHLLPNLSSPGSSVTAAKLFIDGAWIDGRNNLVSIEGTLNWDPLNHVFLDNTTYNLGSVDDPTLWDDGSLDVSVFAGERSLRIDRAILMMDYDEGAGAGSAEVPEPASLILFGIGFIGVGTALRRRRKI